MASRPTPTKTPSRTGRPTRRSTAPAQRAERESHTGSETVSTPSLARDELVDHAWPAEPSLRGRMTSRSVFSPSATRNSTLMFRALLLIAAAAALAFTVAAWIAPPTTGAGNSTSPDAPPPAVFVQPDN